MQDFDQDFTHKEFVNRLRSRLDLLEAVVDLQNKNYAIESRIVAVEERFIGLVNSVKVSLTVAIFFFSIAQGMAIWYMQKFVDRADADHDVLVQIATEANLYDSKSTPAYKANR